MYDPPENVGRHNISLFDLFKRKHDPLLGNNVAFRHDNCVTECLARKSISRDIPTPRYEALSSDERMRKGRAPKVDIAPDYRKRRRAIGEHWATLVNVGGARSEFWLTDHLLRRQSGMRALVALLRIYAARLSRGRLMLKTASLLVFAGSIVAAAQQPAFEVASVKENISGKGPTKVQFSPGGRFVADGLPLTIIIAIAYSLPLQSDRLKGGPPWIKSVVYDIEAAAEKSALASGTTFNSRNEKIRLMLQALLADRFKLRIHREIKEGPLYEITTKSGGPKLTKSALTEDDCANSPMSPAPGDSTACHTFSGGAVQGVRARAASMSDLVSWMSNWTDHPVIDKTGLQGLFDIETEGWDLLLSKAPPPGQERPTGEANRPTLFQIFDRLGLKLQLRRGPTEIFVIDHVERPTPN